MKRNKLVIPVSRGSVLHQLVRSHQSNVTAPGGRWRVGFSAVDADQQWVSAAGGGGQIIRHRSPVKPAWCLRLSHRWTAWWLMLDAPSSLVENCAGGSGKRTTVEQIAQSVWYMSYVCLWSTHLSIGHLPKKQTGSLVYVSMGSTSTNSCRLSKCSFPFLFFCFFFLCSIPFLKILVLLTSWNKCYNHHCCQRNRSLPQMNII